MAAERLRGSWPGASIQRNEAGLIVAEVPMPGTSRSEDDDPPPEVFWPTYEREAHSPETEEAADSDADGGADEGADRGADRDDHDWEQE